MVVKETVPYHFRSYKDGEYSFVEHESVTSATAAIDFSRDHENNLVDNLLVWGTPGRERSGYTTDADFENPAPGGLKTAFLVLLGALFILLVMVSLTRFADEQPIEERFNQTP